MKRTYAIYKLYSRIYLNKIVRKLQKLNSIYKNGQLLWCNLIIPRNISLGKAKVIAGYEDEVRINWNRLINFFFFYFEGVHGPVNT